MTNPIPVEGLSEERLSEIAQEFSELGTGMPSELQDGPGTVSGFYTSLSIADVCALVTELQHRRHVTGSANIEHVDGDTLRQHRREAEAGTEAGGSRGSMHDGVDAVTYVQKAYDILCAGNPPSSARESNARRALRVALNRDASDIAASVGAASPPASGVRVSEPEPDLFLLPESVHGPGFKPLAVCIAGRYAGWLMWKHPDGQWVTYSKLETADASAALHSAFKSALGEHP